jgi:thermostable 8-oxoguanine DNA glycosylase
MIDPRRSASTGVPASRPRAGQVSADRLAELEARLAKLERSPGLRERSRSLMDRVIPREASHHFRNAGREELLGIRAIVDFWIDRIDEAEGRSGGTRRESIEIE